MNATKLQDYEQGNLDDNAEIKLFQELIDSGLAWELQGHYGRKAIEYIKRGLCALPATDDTYAMYGIDDGPAPTEHVGAIWGQEPQD